MEQFSEPLKPWAPLPTALRMPLSAPVISGIGVAIDSVVLICAGLIASLAVAHVSVSTWETYVASICFIWISSLLIFQFSGLYAFDALVHPTSYADKIVIALVAAFLFLLAAAYSFKVSSALSRVWIGAFSVGAVIAVLSARTALSLLVANLSQRGVCARNVVVAGNGPHAARLLRHRRPDFVKVLGIFVDQSQGRSQIAGFPVLGTMDQIASFVRGGQVDDIVIALPWSAEDQVTAMVERLRELPVDVYLASELLGFNFDVRERPSHFDNVPVFAVTGRPLAGWGGVLKAVEDYVGASLALICLLPLMALIALVVKLDSAGPVLFTQKRLGFNNREFNIYKFRSMRNDVAPAGRTVQATRNDERVTRLGRLLRRSSLDELPQLFNVLNGTMSLVGPRPHALDHNEEYSRTIRSYFSRHRVKPGITGWAQVNGLRGETRSERKMAERVRFDIFYVENWSLLFDLRIVLRTFVVCLGGRNAY